MSCRPHLGTGRTMVGHVAKLSKNYDFSSPSPRLEPVICNVWFIKIRSIHKLSLWLYYDFFGQILVSYCKFFMPSPLKWSILGAHTIILSKNINTVTKTDCVWFEFLWIRRYVPYFHKGVLCLNQGPYEGSEWFSLILDDQGVLTDKTIRILCKICCILFKEYKLVTCNPFIGTRYWIPF